MPVSGRSCEPAFEPIRYYRSRDSLRQGCRSAQGAQQVKTQLSAPRRIAARTLKPFKLAHRSCHGGRLPRHDALRSQQLLAESRAARNAAGTGHGLQWRERASSASASLAVM